MVDFSTPNIQARPLVSLGGMAISDAISRIPANQQAAWENQQARQLADTRRSTLAGLGTTPSGEPDYAGASLRLAQGGDLQGAQSFATLAMAQGRQGYQQKQDSIQNDFERQKIDIMRQRVDKDGHPTFGLNPQYGVDANGNPVLLQIGSNGSVRQAQMPNGVSLSNKPITLDAGTHFVVLDPVTRQPVGTMQKNVAGAAQQKALGTASGEALAQLPGAEGMANQISAHIDSLADDKYLPSMLGPLASRMPNVTTDAARVQSKMDQLGGGAFLQARQMLKGQGAITDFESKRAEAAYARLNAAQSFEDYKAALTEFKDALTSGLTKLRSQAAMVPGAGSGQPQGGASGAGQGSGQYAPGGMQPGAGQGGGGPRPGAVVNGFVYKGGNPKDPNSWGRAQ
ncbi:hypothetical protein GGQ86_004262 [Xanthobacter flavus]|uniref:Uncharacterized protein n=2 Tax=Xanthobacter flavus TaxID=281 RepID=A0ABU1KMC9_XANFL|nr:hypothetical protein [Xanthobacter flavus]MDR6335766.1 hypothetical protein [Xanthobacter flavus]